MGQNVPRCQVTRREEIARAEYAQEDFDNPWEDAALHTKSWLLARADRILDLIAAEREACAKVCEERGNKHHGTFTEDIGESYELGWREDEARDCAAAIRARGDK